MGRNLVLSYSKLTLWVAVSCWSFCCLDSVSCSYNTSKLFTLLCCVVSQCTHFIFSCYVSQGEFEFIETPAINSASQSLLQMCLILTNTIASLSPQFRFSQDGYNYNPKHATTKHKHINIDIHRFNLRKKVLSYHTTVLNYY